MKAREFLAGELVSVAEMLTAKTKTKYENVGEMRRELDAMLDDIAVWMTEEEEAAKSFKTSFDFMAVYKMVEGALDMARDKLKRAEGKV